MNKLPQRRSRSRRLAFETLEPRALLSADLLPVAALPEPPAPIAAEFREYVAIDTSPVILAAAEPPRELVIVDGMVAEADRLATDWRNRGFEVVVLDRTQDAISQIDDLLATRTGLAAVHLVSHGTHGALQLGGTTFDAATLSTRSVEVARWSQAFAADGDLLLYGCDVAGEAWGGTFIERLALLTGADVSASTDDTGAALLGGNWTLEYATGAIETHTLDAADWLHLLAPQTITWSTVAWTNGNLGPVNIAIGALGNVVVTLSGDTAQLQTNSPSIGSSLQGGFGGSAGSSLNLDSNGGFASTQSVNVLFDFSALPGEVVDLSFYVFDIDISNGGGGFIDRVTVTANAGALNPTTVTASGIDNFVSSANTITGQNGNSGNPSGDGNGFFAFSQRGLASINLNYGNANTTGQSTQGIGVNTITFHIAPKNTAPATVTTPENTAFAFTGGNALSVSDDDATSVTLSVANGSLGLTASGGATLGGSGGNRTISGTLAAINATLASLVYTPNAGYNGSDTLTFTSSDGTYTDTDLVAITVTPVNDVPAVGNVAGDARSYAAGSGAVIIDQGGNATVTDVDSADFNGGSLTVSIVSGGVALEDVLGIQTSGTVTLSAGVTIGSTVSIGGTAIGTITSAGTSGASLTVALNASATTARVESLVRAITYQDTAAVNPTPGTRTIRFTVNDGDGGTSAAVDATVTVKPVASIAATDSAAAEPANNGQFTVTLSASSATDTVITYSIGGTATSTSDYGALTGSATILAGATSATINVTTVDDALVEPGETVVLTLTGITSGDSDIRIRSDANTATVNLADDDAAQVSVAATTAAAEPGTNGVFTVSMTKASSTNTVISYSIGGTAASGTDFTALSGSVTILAGNTSATIGVPVLDDLVVEAGETVVLTLTAITSGDPDIGINGAANSAAVTIADNDTAQVSIAATTAAAAEPATNGAFTVSMTRASSTATTISYTVGGTATSGSDYTALSGSVTIAAGATTATISVPVLNDTLVEAAETVVVTLNAITSGDPDITINGAANSATVNIADNDTAQVSVAATTAAAAEGGANGLYTVTLSNASSTATTISYTVGGTATAGTDYTALSGTVTIAAGATTATIAVTVTNDTLVEASETVVVTLDAVTAGDPDISINGAADNATVTIADNDTALVSIAATTSAAAEGGANGLYTVTLSNASSTATTVSYTVTGTAAAGSDYTALSGTVTIAAGATTATIPVTVTNDTLVEASETVIVTLNAVTAGDPDISINGAADSATVTIADNDTAQVSIAATTAAAEPVTGGLFTVTLSAASSTATTLTYTVGGTATAGTDYTALSGTVTIAAGATTATIGVPVLDDSLVEGGETVVVTLASIASGDADISINGAANSATVTIADNDTAQVSIAATTAAAAEGGANGVDTVTLSNASATATTVSYTVSGTATSGGDFTALSGSVTIAAGATTATITVPVIDDVLVEAGESVVVTLGAVTAGDPGISINGAANAATVTIADNDAALVSIAATTAAAAEGGVNGVYTVSLSNASSTATTVSYTVTGTAASGSDFTALSGTVTIAAGATTATITVPVIDDSLVEASETVIVTLAAITSGDPDISIDGGSSSATVNIADNDSALLSIAATTPAAAEGGANGAYTVSMTNASSTDTTVSYTVTGTAASGSDFTPLSGTVTILAGATTATITVPVVNDSLVEAGETVVVTLNAITAGDPDVAIDGAASNATVTIADNDTALVSIATTANAAEPGTGGLFTVTMTNASSTDTVVAFTITGTAASGVDFVALPVSATITAGSTTATVAVPVIDDALVEATETVIATLTGITSGDAEIAVDGAANAATVAITDNDTALVSVAATAPNAAEGGAGGTFTVTMSKASSTDTVVGYTVGGTAVAGADYAALTGTVTILAGSTSATIPVAVTNDGLVELTETVTVTLSSVAGDPDISVDAGASAATVSIADNDSALVSIAATDAAAGEPADDGRFTVSMSAAASTDTVIAYAIAGTAAAGTDYTAVSGTVTVLAGATSATIDVSVLNDLVVEGDETVVLTLTAITSGDADIAIDGVANAATVTIADEDTALVSVATTLAAAEPGTTGRFTVTLSQASSTDTVIAYGIAGTALGGTDYAALSGTVTIVAGATTAFIDVAVLNDALVEANETVVLTLASITAGDPDIAIDGAASAATVVITDNDTAQVSIASTGGAAEPGTNGQFTVTMSAASSTDTVVGYTVGGTATAGADYAALSGTVTILAGSTTATIAVAVIDENLVEATESVVVTLTGFVSADADVSIGATNVATVNIADDDTALVSIAATTPGAAEPGTNGRFTVSMTNASSTDTVIAYGIAGSAANGADYALLSGSVTILAGATSATIDVSVVDDLVVEATETVVLTLTGITAGDPQIAVDAGANAATVTITDNDVALVSIAATTPNAAEPGANGQYTVTMSLVSSTDTVVSYAVAGTAIAGTDYTALSGTVTILAGSTTATISVPVIDDAIVEGSETVIATLGAITSGDPDISIDGGANIATVTIGDNDAALASIAVTAAPAEPGTAGEFTVTLSNVSSTDTVLSYSVAGTATAGIDYAALSGTVTIAAGSSSATIALDVIDDALVEANETVIVALTAITSGDPDIAIDGVAADATATIVDDDTALVAIAATTPAAGEGGATGRFTVSMTNAASTDTVIAYGIAGTAANGADYTLLSGSVTIVAGSTTAFIDVAAIDDLVVEATETAALTLTAITSGDADISIDGASATATATIADDDAATLTVGDATVNEAAGTISFNVTVDRAVQGGFTVDASFAGGNANGGADYADAAQTLAFAGNAGETQVVTLAIVNDAVVEATETFGVSLSNVTPATAPAGSIDAGDTATGTILDNDVATLTIADVAVSEAVGSLTFAVTLDLAVQGGFSVVATFTDGTATGGVDYTSALQALNFAGTAGETILVTVPVVNDPLVEANETFTIALTNVVPATAPAVSVIITDTAVGTIANDDHAPTIDDAAVTLQENSAAGTTAIDLADSVALGDLDQDGDAITYSIIAGNAAGGFAIDTATGAITVANPLPLDFETTPTFVLTVLASDGTNTDTATITVDLLNVNEAPTAIVPGAQTAVEDTPVTLSVAGGNGIVVADVDAAGLQVTLGAVNGTMTLATLAGLTFTAGDGTADTAMTFTGSLAAINAALDGLVYAPRANYNGTDGITLLLDDQGQSGLGGAQTLAASVPLSVTAVNDAPAIAGDRGLAVAEGNPVTITAADLAGLDVDDAGAGLVYTLAGAPGNGQLEFIDAAGAAITTFTQADLDAGRVRYVHDGSETTADVFTVMLADGGEDGAAPAFATINVAITPVNDAPRLIPGDGTVDQGDTLVLTAAQVGAVDPDSAADALVYVVDGTTGGFIELATAAGVPIASFTGAQLASGVVRFVQSDASATSAGFSVHVNDGQAASAPGVVVLTLRATGGLPPQDAPTASTSLDVMQQTSAVSESRGTDVRGPQVAQFIRAPLYESGGPALAEPEPFVPPTPRTRLAASGAIETPSIEIASSGLRFEAPGLGETSIPQLEFSFQSARYDLPGAEDAVPRTRSAIVDAVQIAGLALTAGGVWWVLRIGSLIGSALVSAPAWRHIDPLPVLGGRDREDDVDWEGEEEPSESGDAAERFFDQASAKTPQA